MRNEVISADGEIIDSAPGTDMSLAVGLTRAEIDSQIATARAYPRSIKRATDTILSLATLDEETSEECMYALPRGGKPIQGPSIRLAEIIQQSWGNNRVAARVVAVDRIEKFVEAEGVYHDLETNSATMARVRRRISGKSGQILTDDMIIVTGNAACSIAKRNAILAGVPKPVWRRAYDAAQRVISGSSETLTVTRDRSLKAFANFGVKPEQIFVALGVGGLDDIGLDLIPTLRGMFSALKNSEATVEEMFSPKLAPAASKAQAEALAEKLKASGSNQAAGFDPAFVKSEAAEARGEKTQTLSPISASEAADLIATAETFAAKGRREYDTWYGALTPAARDALAPQSKALMAAAHDADHPKKESAKPGPINFDIALDAFEKRLGGFTVKSALLAFGEAEQKTEWWQTAPAELREQAIDLFQDCVKELEKAEAKAKKAADKAAEKTKGVEIVSQADVAVEESDLTPAADESAPFDVEESEADKLLAEGRGVAMNGVRKLKFWIGKLNAAQYDMIKAHEASLQKAAKAADEAL